MREVAGRFLKLGLTGFGGPAAYIALMRDEVVRRRGWGRPAGVNAGSVALMGLVTWQLARDALVSLVLWVVRPGSLLLLRVGVNSASLVAAGALAGWLLR